MLRLCFCFDFCVVFLLGGFGVLGVLFLGVELCLRAGGVVAANRWCCGCVWKIMFLFAADSSKCMFHRRSVKLVLFLSGRGRWPARCCELGSLESYGQIAIWLLLGPILCQSTEKIMVQFWQKMGRIGGLATQFVAMIVFFVFRDFHRSLRPGGVVPGLFN